MARKSPKNRFASLVGAAAMTLGGVLAMMPTANAQATPEIQWEPCPVHVDAPTAQCGRFATPMDYSNPAGAKISIGVMKIPAANPAARRGALYGNPGGPGGDAYTYFGTSQAGFQWPQEIRDEWDLIAVQPRGLLHSTPLECSFPESGDLSSAAKLQADMLLNTGAATRQLCQGPIPGYAQTLTTENNARDWEAARKALGYDTISIMGLSYGTYLGSAYATLFPNTTDKVVLDSAMDPNAQWQKLMSDQQAGYERVLNEYFDYVARNDERYQMGNTPLKAYQYWSNKIVAETGTNPTVTPPPARVGDLPPGLAFVGQAGADAMTATGKARVESEGIVSRLLNPGANQVNSKLLSATRFMLPQAMNWDTLARLTNGTLQTPLAGEPIPDPSKEVLEEFQAQQIALVQLQGAQLCNENVSPANPLLIPAYVWSNFVTGDIFTAPNAMIGSGAYCNGAAPVTGKVALSAAGLKTRPMQINAINDPQTIYAGHGTIANAMNSQLVTVHGPGHGHVALGNKVVDRMVVDYLRTGKVTSAHAPGYFEALSY
ncbi:alpha/beta fold hydrolase [Corynebacterium mayonis]|uniref:alpha/beta fold hydrolase n=1 Tax=Corynebacterium mayonis TaxID=3062461 RepID=UPI003140483C